MAGTKLFYDGKRGFCQYENKEEFFTYKPSLAGFPQFTGIVYSEDEEIALISLTTLVTRELTESEINVIKLFCEATAIVEKSDVTEVEAHNIYEYAHPSIRYQLSNLHEFAHKVATVWSTELSLEDYNKEEFKIPWNYVIGDSIDCTDSLNSTNWKCPVGESYDIRVRLGFEGVDTTEAVTVVVTLKKLVGDTETIIKKATTTIPKNAVGLPMVQLEATGVNLAEGDKVITYAKISSASGLIVPSRTFFTVDNHGAVMAQRQADYFYNTLGNLVFYNGYEATLNGDSNGIAQVIANKWNNAVIEL